jgi:peptidoglycan/xylan/chitin deacetylase (PgdA/CDA1 family)
MPVTIGTMMTSAAKATVGPAARRITGSAPRVLMYHRFGADGDPRRLSARDFAQQLDYLTRHFRVRRLGDVVRWLQEGRALEPRTVVLTVDDGYADFVEFAYPLLQRYAVPATVFVVADFLDQQLWLWFDAIRFILEGARATRLDMRLDGQTIRLALSTPAERDRAWVTVCDPCSRMDTARRTAAIAHLQHVLDVPLPARPPAGYEAMTWDDAARLDRTLVEIGSHTCTHPVLSRCTTEEIDLELRESKRRIEARLGVDVNAFAYPHGEPADYDERAIRAVEAAGYACATVAHGGLLHRGANRFRLERLSAATDAVQFRSTVNGLEFLANRCRAWRHAAAF